MSEILLKREIIKKLLYALFILLFVLTLFLTFFEFTLFYFHEPLNSSLGDASAYKATWLYLLKQQYITLIDFDGYSIHEKRHLLDVKRLFETLYSLWLGLLAFSFMGLLFVRKNFKAFLRQSLFLGLMLTIAFILLSVNFLHNFQSLHQLLFAQQTWIFPDNSLLISLFPLVYFQQFFLLFCCKALVVFALGYFFVGGCASQHH